MKTPWGHWCSIYLCEIPSTVAHRIKNMESFRVVWSFISQFLALCCSDDAVAPKSGKTDALDQRPCVAAQSFSRNLAKTVVFKETLSILQSPQEHSPSAHQFECACSFSAASWSPSSTFITLTCSFQKSAVKLFTTEPSKDSSQSNPVANNQKWHGPFRKLAVSCQNQWAATLQFKLSAIWCEASKRPTAGPILASPLSLLGIAGHVSFDFKSCDSTHSLPYKTFQTTPPRGALLIYWLVINYSFVDDLF